MKIPYKIEPKNCGGVESGYEGLVYLVNDNLAIKIPHKNVAFNSDPKKEYLIQSMIYSAGFLTPMPYGVFPVKIDDMAPIDGFFMERIHGVSLEGNVNWSYDYAPEARKIVEEIGRKLRIFIDNDYDLHPKNVMIDRRRNRIVLIDFRRWTNFNFVNSSPGS